METVERTWWQDRWIRRRDILRHVKELFPCEDCGGYFPHYVMQWDHVPEMGTSGKPYGGSFYQWAWPRILLELDKCELVCANCHCERTFRRLSD